MRRQQLRPELKSRVARLDITPKILVGGAAELIEEVTSKKIAGEEDRYARIDLWDFQAYVDGAQKIVSLLQFDLRRRDPELMERIDTNCAKVNRGWPSTSAPTAASSPSTR